jgi:hypothetical protein
MNENKKIKKTKLLYVFTSMKLLNPHVHIDGKPNYVVIMTLVNCDFRGNPYMLVMYSEKALKPYQKNQTDEEKGFIASVNNKQIYHLLKSNKKACIT